MKPASIAIRARPFVLPLRRELVTSHGPTPDRVGVIVQVRSDTQTGWSEIAILPSFRPISWQALAWEIERQAAHTNTDALDRHDDEAALLLRLALSAINAAMRDLVARLQGVSLGSTLSQTGQPPRTAIPVNVTLDGPQAVAQAQAAIARGFTCVKLKVGTEPTAQAEIDRIAAVRQAIGPQAHLRLDANEAWTRAQAEAILRACLSLDIQYIEQPVARADLESMRALRAIGIPIAADEAASSAQAIDELFEHEALDVLVIKPALFGGVTMTSHLIEHAAQHGVRPVLTSAIESGIGIASSLHLAAACPEVELECGLATLDLLKDDLIVEDLPIEHGMMRVPAGPGLGVTLDERAFRRYEITH